MASLEQITLLFEASNANMNKGFENLHVEMKEFKEEVKQTIADSVKLTNEKVEILEAKLQEKDEEIKSLQKDLDLYKRKNNLVVFGVQDNEQTIEELEAIISNLFKKVAGIEVNENDYSDIFRLGKIREKCRPILVSFVSNKKMRAILQKKNLFRAEKVTVSADLPKEVVEERKRLQPMVTALNKAGIKAYLRLDAVFVNGKKLSKTETEEEMQKFKSMSKRVRSPEETAILARKRITAPKLNINAAVHQTKPQDASTSSSPAQASLSETSSTPSRMFPVFKLPQTERSGELSPMPGGSKHSKTFEIRVEE